MLLTAPVSVVTVTVTAPSLTAFTIIFPSSVTVISTSPSPSAVTVKAPISLPSGSGVTVITASSGLALV